MQQDRKAQGAHTTAPLKQSYKTSKKFGKITISVTV